MADVSSARDCAIEIITSELPRGQAYVSPHVVDALRAHPEVLRALAGEAGAADTPPADERMGQALVQIERLREDVAMYERWAEESPTRVVECSCGRHQVRIADHEISEAVPAAAPTPTDDAWSAVETVARELEILARPDTVHGKWILGKLATNLRAVLARRTEGARPRP